MMMMLWMFQSLGEDPQIFRVKPVVKQENSGSKRQAGDEITTSPKKTKHGSAKTPTKKQAKDERKQAFQEWMQGDSSEVSSEVWTQYPPPLVFRFKNGKTVWSAGEYDTSDGLAGGRDITIENKWSNVCYHEDGENPWEKPGRQQGAIDLDTHGHIGWFKCTKSRKRICHCCKQYGYF
jgi:hypothetical protein